MDIRTILKIEEGPRRTSALAAWFQGLYPVESDKPVLVGGAAVELYTRGAYRTSDLDFVGRVPPGVQQALRQAGFQRRGRHWVYEAGRLFIELPSPSFDHPARVDTVQLDEWSVLVLSPEDVLVDRLASWVFWSAPVDGINAFLLWKDRGSALDLEWLEQRARQEGVADALASLREVSEQNPAMEEVERWAQRSR